MGDAPRNEIVNVFVDEHASASLSGTLPSPSPDEQLNSRTNRPEDDTMAPSIDITHRRPEPVPQPSSSSRTGQCGLPCAYLAVACHMRQQHCDRHCGHAGQHSCVFCWYTFGLDLVFHDQAPDDVTHGEGRAAGQGSHSVPETGADKRRSDGRDDGGDVASPTHQWGQCRLPCACLAPVSHERPRQCDRPTGHDGSHRCVFCWYSFGLDNVVPDETLEDVHFASEQVALDGYQHFTEPDVASFLAGR